MLQIKHWPLWKGEEILRHQLAIMYPLVRFCKDENGHGLSDLSTKELVQMKIFRGVYSQSCITDHLKDDDHQTTKLVASMIWPERHRLGLNAHELHKEYAKEMRQPEPKLIIPQSE